MFGVKGFGTTFVEARMRVVPKVLLNVLYRGYIVMCYMGEYKNT